MNTQQARKLWLKQLRSPEAKYCRGKLENPDNPNARCCLGHACHALNIPRERPYTNVVRFDGEETHLSQSVASMLDITPVGEFRVKVVIDRKAYWNLAVLNDYESWPPAKMADFLEANWDNLKDYK